MRTVGRGRYDRAQSRSERAATQRRRLFEAAAAALERHGALALTVDRVLEGAPMGRNTFYEHFSDVNELVTALVSHAEDEIFSAVDARGAVARTPREGLRALALAWLEETAARPSLALALLVHGPAALPLVRPSAASGRSVPPRPSLASPAVLVFARRPAGGLTGAGVTALSKRLRALLEQARRDALTSVRPEAARVDAVAAAMARLALAGLDVGDEQRRALAALGADLAVRAFR